MKAIMENKPLQEIATQSRPVHAPANPRPLANIQAAADLQNPYWILTYRHDSVLLTHSSHPDAKTILGTSLDEIKEARLFNATAEIRLWTYEGKWHARKREDLSNGTKSHVLDENRILIDDLARFVEPKLLPILKEKGTTSVHVRNYFEYDNDGMIRFTDARLVSLLDAKGVPVHAC
jgi:hypothetical protein